MLEKTLESPLYYKEIQPVHPKGDQSWVFIGRPYVEAETPILCPPDAKNWLIWKDPDAWKDWGQEKKGTTEDEMAGWHHRLDGCEFEWTPGDGDGQGLWACCDSWGCRESDMTELLNWCYTSRWISNRYTYVLSLLNFPPTSHLSRLLQGPGLSFLSQLFEIQRKPGRLKLKPFTSKDRDRGVCTFQA